MSGDVNSQYRFVYQRTVTESFRYSPVLSPSTVLVSQVDLFDSYTKYTNMLV